MDERETLADEFCRRRIALEDRASQARQAKREGASCGTPQQTEEQPSVEGGLGQAKEVPLWEQLQFLRDRNKILELHARGLGAALSAMDAANAELREQLDQQQKYADVLIARVKELQVRNESLRAERFQYEQLQSARSTRVDQLRATTKNYLDEVRRLVD